MYICLPHFFVISLHCMTTIYVPKIYCTYIYTSFTLQGNLKDTVFTWKRPEYPDSKNFVFGVQSPERRRSMGSTMPRHHWCPIEGSLQDSAKSTTTWHLREHRNSVWLVNLSWSSLQRFIPDMITVATMGEWTKTAESTSQIILIFNISSLKKSFWETTFNRSPSPKPIGHNGTRRILMLILFSKFVKFCCYAVTTSIESVLIRVPLGHRGHVSIRIHWYIHWYVSKGTKGPQNPLMDWLLTKVIYE